MGHMGTGQPAVGEKEGGAWGAPRSKYTEPPAGRGQVEKEASYFTRGQKTKFTANP